MSFLGALAGAGLDFGGQMAGGFLGRHFQGLNQKAQYNYWKKSQINGPSYQREGLENAGFNPMLALSGGAASAFTPTAQSGVNVGSMVGSAKQGAELARDIKYMNELSKKQAEADIEKTKAETDKIKTSRYDNLSSNIIESFVNRVKGLTGSTVGSDSSDSEKKAFFTDDEIKALDDISKDGYKFFNPVGSRFVFGDDKKKSKSEYKMPSPSRGGRKRRGKYGDAFINSSSYHYD